MFAKRRRNDKKILPREQLIYNRGMKKIIMFVGLILFVAVRPAYAKATAGEADVKVKLPEFHFAEEVNLNNKKIENDVLSAGGKVNIDKDTVIDGYLILAGGEIVIDGTIKKNVIVAGGDVKFGPNAKIDGYLVTAGGKVTVDAAAMIKGEKIIKTAPLDQPKVRERQKINLIGWMSSALTLMVMVMLFKNIKWSKKYLLTIFKGFGVLILWPIGMIMLVVTIIGAPIGLIGMFLYFVCLYLANLVSAWGLGKILGETKVFNIKNEYLLALLGLVLLSALKWIPGAGMFVSLIAMLWGLGTIWQLK